MTSFGVNIGSRLAPPPSASATDTGTLHLAAPAASGPVDKAYLLETLDDLTNVFTGRTGATIPTYDYLDGFFREGGRRCYLARYTTTAYQAALDLLQDPAHGPGNVGVVGVVPDSALFEALQDHCEAANGQRVALRDVNLGDSVSAMSTVGDLAPAGDDLGATFGPWVHIPAPSGVVGGTGRQIPASAVVAALCNRVDSDGNPNRAAAGLDYFLQYVDDIAVQGILDSDRVALFTHGVNTIASIDGVLQGYGFQTNVPQSADTPFWQFNCSRARMWLKNQARKRGQAYMFRPIDGKGKLAARLKEDLNEEFFALYEKDGLFGDVPGNAYSINVTESVNTTTTIAQGELHAVAQAVFALHAKAIDIDLVTVPIGAKVAQ